MAHTLNALLQGYSQQRIPSLASRTSILSSRLEVNMKRTDAIQDGEAKKQTFGPDDEECFWAAIIRMIGAYADSSDLLIVEPISSDKVSTFRIKIEQNATRKEACKSIAKARRDEKVECSLEELINASKEAGMNLVKGQSPALITIGTDSISQNEPDWYLVQGIAILIDVGKQALSLIGDANIISKEMADVLGRQIWQLYAQIKNEPNLPYKRLQLDSNDLLSQYEQPYDPNEAHLPIEWLRKNAKNRPEAIAHELCDEPDDEHIRYLTFAQLDESSNKMANWLVQKHDVQQGQPIGVMRKRDEQFYIAMAAILKAGCCYLPIDKDLPKERKEFIIRDSDAALLLTDEEEAKANLANKASIDLDDISTQTEIACFDSSVPNVKVDLNDLAYILYTSGTSGNPKGCLLMHRGLYWAIKMFVEIPSKITNPDTDKRLAMAAVAFDVHVSEMVQGWAIGTRLVSVSSRMSLLADLQGTIERFGITHIGMVPSMIEATLTKQPSELPLKYITSGGEKINDNVLRKWASNPNILFGNLYGPTEATIGCTARIIRGTDEPKEDIGYAFVGSGAYIVDSELNILPKGISGELIIEGPLIARGYLNLPEATKKSFIEWPRKGCRAYRTGDLVRMNFDGSLSIHGRIDSQIKLRGVRIESEGVSAVISNASKQVGIDAVSVICKHEAVGNADMLITFITLKNKKENANQRRGKPEVTELQDTHLMNTLRKASVEGLASYMRPSHIIPLTFFPLSHNGKIDTKPLATLFAETSMSTLMKVQGLIAEGVQENDTFVGPSSEEEEIVVESIADLVGIEYSKLSMKQKLLEIGLSSLNCANLTAILRSRTGVRLNVSDILSCETVADCATLIVNDNTNSEQAFWDQKQFHKAHIDAVHQQIAPKSIEGIFPPLPVQPGVLFHAMQEKTGYVQHFTYQINDGDISIDDIQSAWKVVQNSLDILRTVFVLDQGEVVQVVLQNDACSIPFKVREVRSSTLLNKDDFEAFVRDERMLESAASQINKDFGSPMFLVTVFEAKESPPAKVMTVSFSHTIYDAFAVRNIMNVFDNALSKSTILEKHISMATLVDQLNSISDQQHQNYWQSALEDAIEERKRLSWQPLQIPKGETSRRINKVFDIALDDVQKYCNSIGITLQTLFNVTFGLSARSIFQTWRNHALFGNVRSGRNLPLIDIHQAAYPLVTVVPCVIDFSSKRIDQILKSAQSSLTKSIEHENVALSQIQIWSKSRNLIDILFSCRIEQSQDRSNAYKSIKHFSTSQMDPEFPLAIEVLLDQNADSIDVRVAHTPSVITKDQIADLIQQMQANIRALLDGEQMEISSDDSLTLIAKPEQKKESSIDVDPKLINDLQEALSSFLKVERNVLQPNTSLVSLGMTSLRAVAFSHSIMKSLDLHIDPIDVVQGDNSIAIAQAITQKNKNMKTVQEIDTTWTLSKEEESELGDIKLDKDDDIKVAPCTPLQAGMLAQTIASEGKLYVHAFVMKLIKKDQATIDRILGIWSDIYATYGILRTSFHFLSSNGQWIQAEHSAKSYPLIVSEVVEEVDESQARSLSIARLNIKGEEGLQKPPIQLIHFPKSGFVVLALHHALYDGVSLANLFEYATNLYNGIPLPQTPSFLPVARQIVSSEEKATSYWVERLQSVRQNVFVKQRKGDNQSVQAWRDSISFNQEENESVQSFKRRYGVSTQSIGQVAFAYTLFDFGKKNDSDIVFCQIVSGRTKREAGKVIGPVFNTVAIRVNLTGNVKAKEIVQKIQFENGQSLPWQHAPLRNVQRQLRKTSLSDALFLYQPGVEKGNDTHATSNKPWTLVTSTAEEGSTQFTLNLELHDVADKDGTLSVKASCAADVLSQSELRNIVQLFKSKLLGIVQNPNKVLAPGVRKASTSGTGQLNGKMNGTNDEAGKPISDATLASILCQVLHVKQELIKTHTNLSSIGLDSIAAMQIASRARKQGYNFTPMQVLRCTSVNELLAIAKRDQAIQQNHKGRIDQDVIKPAKHIVQKAKDHLDSSIAEYAEGYLPTAGMRYLFSGWQRSGGRQFQICIGRKTESGGERLNIVALKKSWSSLVSRHAILRSTIVPSGSVEVPLVLFVIQRGKWNGLQDLVDKRKELQSANIEEQQSYAKEFGRTLLRSPANNNTPNSRLVILQLPEFDSFFVQMPHTHYDAFTVPRLLNELSQEYVRNSKDEQHQDTTSKDDLKELETYLTHCMLGDEFDQHTLDTKRKDYFQKSLGNQSAPHIWQDTTLTKANPDIAHKSITYYVRELRQGTPTVDELQQCAERMQLTPAAIITSTWAHVHSFQMGRSSSTFAFVNSGRSAETAGMEDIFAPTINLVPTFLNGLQGFEKDGIKDNIALRSSVIHTAKRVQEHWKQQPSWAIQSTMSDMLEWVNCPSDQSAIFNTTLNVQIRPSKQAGSLKDAVKFDNTVKQDEKPNWLPLPLQAAPHPPFNDRGWTKEDLNAFRVPNLFLDANGCVTDPSVRIDARMVVAASQATKDQESIVILEAEIAREVLSRETVDSALQQWAQLLRLVVEI